MTRLAEWKKAVTAAVSSGTTQRAALLSVLQAQFPIADSKTVGEKISRFLVRDPVTGVYHLRDAPRPLRTRGSSLPPQTGQGWYERFLQRGLSDGFAVRFKETGDGRPWTKLILGVSRSVGEESGFLVRDRPELNRWDQTWLNSKERPVVVIEHENDPESGSGLKSELDHLIPADAALRVLITYYRGSQVVERTASLLDEIRRRLESQGTRDSEFLLLTSRWEVDDARDFRAYVIKPKWVAERL
jgi:hypothetical protein